MARAFLFVYKSGDCKHQVKSVTPTESIQRIIPDSGYDAFSYVNVDAIPENYADTSESDALEEMILEGATAYVKGKRLVGTMPKRASSEKRLGIGNERVSISKGFHDGEGSVFVELEEKTVTPGESVQLIYPSDGKLLASVTVTASERGALVRLENGILSIL